MDDQRNVKLSSRDEVMDAARRKAIPDGADLSEMDLSGLRLAGIAVRDLNLSKANLSGAAVAGASLPGANLRQARLAGVRVAGTNLAGADFTGADLSGARLAAVNVSGADFTNARVDGVRAAGVNWQSARVPPVPIPLTAPTPPPWLAGVFLGTLAVLAYILLRRRRPA